MSFVLALALLQVGPFSGAGAKPVSPLPPELQNRRRPAAAQVDKAPAPPLPLSAQLRECLDQAAGSPATALITAGAWRLGKLGADAAPPLLCLGTAQANLAQWDEAEASFLAARDAAGARNAAGRAGLGAMAGNAALASGANPRALGLLDIALADAAGGADGALVATIQIDRARALVALRREAEAATALAQAREAAPDSGEAWLLSATLSRRTGDLATAQAQIEKAAALQPRDPDTGLEAGVIAVLSGHGDAARKSWASVIAAAPGTPQAQAAQGYIDQLGAP